VRGLDYYTRTVFEVTHKELGSQNAIGAGGRYDDLISDMGGPKLGACGFAVGVDRIMLALGKASISAWKRGACRPLLRDDRKNWLRKSFYAFE